MNWLMQTHPIVLAAWVVAVIGTILFLLGRRGKLISRAEFCRKCGHETTSAGARCTECGAPLSVTSMRLAFELNHPLLASLGSVTRRGRRAPNTSLIAWGVLALTLGMVIGVGVPAMRFARIDWNRFRDSESLIASAEKLRFDDPRHARIMGVLETRRAGGQLSTPQLAAVQRITTAVARYKSDLALAHNHAIAQQPIYAAYVPPASLGSSPSAKVSTTTTRADVGPSVANMIDAIALQLNVQQREVTVYEPPPLATGYQQPLATAIDLDPSPSKASGLSKHFEILAGTALPDTATSAVAVGSAIPRLVSIPGLAGRSSLAPRFGSSFGSIPNPTSSLPAGASPFTSTLTPGMVRPTTFNNPALSPTTLHNRPLTPSRISNSFGR